ncbi:MAG TPA: TIGR03643 family protein [Methylovorus sp.]|nr:TIGR03643 family protein [Methylovorus sp.]
MERREAVLLTRDADQSQASGQELSAADIGRVIEMAWEDRTPFEAIAFQFGLSEAAVIDLMRQQLRASAFRLWRKRMQGRATKHAALRSHEVARHRARHRVPQF